MDFGRNKKNQAKKWFPLGRVVRSIFPFLHEMKSWSLLTRCYCSRVELQWRKTWPQRLKLHLKPRIFSHHPKTACLFPEIYMHFVAKMFAPEAKKVCSFFSKMSRFTQPKNILHFFHFFFVFVLAILHICFLHSSSDGSAAIAVCCFFYTSKNKTMKCNFLGIIATFFLCADTFEGSRLKCRRLWQLFFPPWTNFLGAKGKARTEPHSPISHISVLCCSRSFWVILVHFEPILCHFGAFFW